MNYETLLKRVALAENKLLKQGLLKEPLSFSSKNQPIDKPKIRPRIDAKKLFDAQRKKKIVPSEVSPIPETEKKGKWYKTSPILEVDQPTHNINFNEEVAEVDTFAKSGWEKIDQSLETAKMIEQARKVYAPVIKALEERKAKAKLGSK
jgi:hypothetical protein